MHPTVYRPCTTYTHTHRHPEVRFRGRTCLSLSLSLRPLFPSPPLPSLLCLSFVLLSRVRRRLRGQDWDRDKGVQLHAHKQQVLPCRRCVHRVAAHTHTHTHTLCVIMFFFSFAPSTAKAEHGSPCVPEHCAHRLQSTVLYPTTTPLRVSPCNNEGGACPSGGPFGSVLFLRPLSSFSSLFGAACFFDPFRPSARCRASQPAALRCTLRWDRPGTTTVCAAAGLEGAGGTEGRRDTRKQAQGRARGGCAEPALGRQCVGEGPTAREQPPTRGQQRDRCRIGCKGGIADSARARTRTRASLPLFSFHPARSGRPSAR